MAFGAGPVRSSQFLKGWHAFFLNILPADGVVDGFRELVRAGSREDDSWFIVFFLK